MILISVQISAAVSTVGVWVGRSITELSVGNVENAFERLVTRVLIVQVLQFFEDVQEPEGSLFVLWNQSGHFRVDFLSHLVKRHWIVAARAVSTRILIIISYIRTVCINIVSCLRVHIKSKIARSVKQAGRRLRIGLVGVWVFFGFLLAISQSKRWWTGWALWKVFDRRRVCGRSVGTSWLVTNWGMWRRGRTIASASSCCLRWLCIWKSASQIHRWVLRGLFLLMLVDCFFLLFVFFEIVCVINFSASYIVAGCFVAFVAVKIAWQSVVGWYRSWSRMIIVRVVVELLGLGEWKYILLFMISIRFEVNRMNKTFSQIKSLNLNEHFVWSFSFTIWTYNFCMIKSIWVFLFTSSRYLVILQKQFYNHAASNFRSKNKHF